MKDFFFIPEREKKNKSENPGNTFSRRKHQLGTSKHTGNLLFRDSNKVLNETSWKTQTGTKISHTRYTITGKKVVNWWWHSVKSGAHGIKTWKKTDNIMNEEYLSFLYLGGYYLSPLLYDVNEQVTLLQQLVFLPGCIYLQTRRKRAGDAFWWMCFLT